MPIKPALQIKSTVLKGHVNKYAILGLVISILSILLSTVVVCYQLTGGISLYGLIKAQASNPAIWALDLTPFIFAYWGQLFCYELASKAETIIEDTTREFASKTDTLTSKLRYESSHDMLTNLPNHRLFSQRIQQGINQLQNNEQLAVMIIDISGLKEINFNYGSFTGNSILSQFAEKLKTILLEPYMLQAYMGMNMVARLQAAEFGVLIPRLRKEHDIQVIAQQICETTSDTFIVDGHTIDIKTHMGIAIFPIHGDSEEKLLDHATVSMMNAIAEHKSWAIYDEVMDKNYSTKRILLKEINSSIQAEELLVLYQPDLKLSTNGIIGGESQVELPKTAKYGPLDNEQLTSMIVGSSLMKNVTTMTLKTVVSDMQDLNVNHDFYITVHLNYPDMDIVDYLELLLQENPIQTKIRVAMTEKACLSDQKKSIEVLNRLDSLGIKICISDFCSGYSSFIYLNNFPIHQIQIDKSYIANMMSDEKKYKIVDTAACVAKRLNLDIFARGIPDEETKNELIRLGIEYGQGPFFSPLVNKEGLLALIKKD